MTGPEKTELAAAAEQDEVLRTGTLQDIVTAIAAMPYAPLDVDTAAECAREWHGTNAAKHALLQQTILERWPQTEPRLVHRVHTIQRGSAFALFGPDVAKTVPSSGLVSVHRYVVATLNGHDIPLDVTFKVQPWDGVSPMPLACGDGEDQPAGDDPDEALRALRREHGDPRAHAAFEAALVQQDQRVRDAARADIELEENGLGD